VRVLEEKIVQNFSGKKPYKLVKGDLIDS